MGTQEFAGAGPLAVLEPLHLGGDPRGVGSSGHAKLIANFMAALRGEAELAIDGREGRRGLCVILDIYKKAGLI